MIVLPFLSRRMRGLVGIGSSTKEVKDALVSVAAFVSSPLGSAARSAVGLCPRPDEKVATSADREESVGPYRLGERGRLAISPCRKAALVLSSNVPHFT